MGQSFSSLLLSSTRFRGMAFIETAVFGDGKADMEFVPESVGGVHDGGHSAQQEAWHGVASYAKFRECKRIGEATLETNLVAPDDWLGRDLSQLMRGQEVTNPQMTLGVDIDGIRSANRDDATGLWKQIAPTWMRDLALDALVGDVDQRREVPTAPMCLAGELVDLRRRISQMLSIHPPGDLERGVMMVVLLLAQVHVGDAKGDFTAAKVFISPVGDQYSCHNEVFFHYEDGAWCKMGLVAYSSLESVFESPSLAESCFLLLTNLKPDRSFNALFAEVHVVFKVLYVDELRDVLLGAPM